MHPLMRLANAVMLVLFVSWAGFQYNDPDALFWAAIYGAAAIECVLFFLGRLPGPLALAYMGFCLLWAPYLGVRIAVSGEFIFDEEGREMLGLMVCAGWTYVLYVNSRRRNQDGIARHV